MHPAIVIFLSVVIVQTIAAFGKERLEAILWFLYSAIFTRSTFQKQRSLRREVFSLKQELASTSSQDQFAKWAKLRRRVDAGLADLEKTNSEVAKSKTTFSMLFKGVMFVITTVMPFGVTSWYGKTPIFWLPPGESSWFGPLGWFLALPRAPKGAISSTVWQMVCSRTIIALMGALGNLLPGKKEEVVVYKVPAEGGQAGGDGSKGMGEKVNASATASTEATGAARKRTNAKAATVSEKQDL